MQASPTASNSAFLISAFAVHSTSFFSGSLQIKNDVYDDVTMNNGDVAQLVERRTGTPLTQVRFPGAARDFSPSVNFQCRLSYVCPCSPPRAIARIVNICAHVDYGNTIKHPARTVGWVCLLYTSPSPRD